MTRFKMKTAELFQRTDEVVNREPTSKDFPIGRYMDVRNKESCTGSDVPHAAVVCSPIP